MVHKGSVAIEGIDELARSLGTGAFLTLSSPEVDYLGRTLVNRLGQRFTCGLNERRICEFDRRSGIDYGDRLFVSNQLAYFGSIDKIAFGLGDALGEPRDRHADIGRPTL